MTYRMVSQWLSVCLHALSLGLVTKPAYRGRHPDMQFCIHGTYAESNETDAVNFIYLTLGSCPRRAGILTYLLHPVALFNLLIVSHGVIREDP